MDRRQRFQTLEAMRGVAAICVVLFHGEQVFGIARPPGGYLAVDFFFLLSGFIMAHVYEAALDGGLPPRVFLRRRLFRLYPLYLAGTVATALLAVAAIVFRHKDALWASTQPFVSLPLGVLMLPNPVTTVLFPLNNPAWTLLLEIIANAVFAVALLRRRASLLMIIVVSGSALAVSAITYGTLDLGSKADTLPGGFARVLFSFPLGVLLYRIRAIRLPAAFGAAAPLILGALLYADPAASWRGPFDVVLVAVVFPLLLLAASSCEPPVSALRRLYVFLGVISYPLYALHHPAMIMVSGIIERHVQPGSRYAAACFGLLAALLAGAWGAAALDRHVGSAIAARQRRRADRVLGTA